jgi:hypothetical protein
MAIGFVLMAFDGTPIEFGSCAVEGSEQALRRRKGA